MKAILLLISYAILGSLGLTFIKKDLNLSASFVISALNPLFLTGILLYGASFLLWLKILNSHDLSLAFPVASSALFVFISLFSSLILGEHLSFLKIIGMVVITVGIILVARG